MKAVKLRYSTVCSRRLVAQVTSSREGFMYHPQILEAQTPERFVANLSIKSAVL